MITKQQYVEYLLATPINYTCTNLADHLDGMSPDAVSDYLRRERHTARTLWELARPLIDDTPDAYLIIDDSVQDKRYSRQIDLVKRQYSGAERGVVRGIGVVNLVHSTGEEDGFQPVDYRIYAPDADGKTKNDHFREMLIAAVADKHLQAQTVLFDTWYASADNLKLVHRLGRTFYTTLKRNRRVSLTKKDGSIGLEEIDWTPERLAHGVVVRVQKVPFPVRLFKLVAPHGDIDWVITNDLVRATAKALGLTGAVAVADPIVRIRGTLTAYRVHLATGAVCTEAGHYIALALDSKMCKAVHIPFRADDLDHPDEPGDAASTSPVSEIVGRVLLLANDTSITDRATLAQIRQASQRAV